MTSRKEHIVIVGAGALGQVLALRLAERGYPIEAVISRREHKARELAERVNAPVSSSTWTSVPDAFDALFMCVPDDAIPGVAQNLASTSIAWSGRVVAHTSGVLTTSVLDCITDRGASPMGFHPLQTFSAGSLPGAFEGIFIGLEGDRATVEFGKRLATDLGAQPLVIPPGAKARYHLAASVISNFSVTLAAMVEEIVQTVGYDWSEASQFFGPLVQATWNNLRLAAPGQALSGPIVRGDVKTVERHLKALEAHLPHLVQPYVALAVHTLRVARESGRLQPEAAGRLNALLDTYSGL